MNVMCLLCTIVLLASTDARGQTSAPTAREVVTKFGSAPNGLARYNYLVSVMPSLSNEDKTLAQQLLATVESELGLYNEALMTFPFDNRIAPPKGALIPHTDVWEAADAADAVVELAAKRNIVMINEAHHDAHTRELTLALLPRMRALGFQYFAVEALSPKDTELMHRGYVTDTSGSEYLLEPLYGEIVRQAIRLGFTVVPYDADNTAFADRDAAQAQGLYEKIFAKDPHAKLFVHVGYSHIDKTPGNLGSGIQPMAMQLARLTGEDPLCVDQTQFRDVAVGGIDYGFYNTVASHFRLNKPYVLRDRSDNVVWSSDPKRVDVTVILPPAAERDLDEVGMMTSDALHHVVVLPRPPFDIDQRPSWLTLEGQRIPYRISTDACQDHIPCSIEAHYANEPDDATPADRYTFLRNGQHNDLFLYPGHYRLRAWDASGKTLSQQEIDVAKR